MGWRTLLRTMGALAIVAGLPVLAVGACSDAFGQPTESDAGEDAEVDAGADAEPPYPNPPYGIRKGSTIANFVLLTRIPPSTEWVERSLSDFYDPFGKKKIHGIALEVLGRFVYDNALLTSCLEQMAVRWSVYDGRGAKLMLILGGPGATKSEGNKWIDRYKLPFGVALDPEPDGGQTKFESISHVFINPRTMKIVEITTGVPIDGCVFSPELDALLDSNGAPNP